MQSTYENSSTQHKEENGGGSGAYLCWESRFTTKFIELVIWVRISRNNDHSMVRGKEVVTMLVVWGFGSLENRGDGLCRSGKK